MNASTYAQRQTQLVGDVNITLSISDRGLVFSLYNNQPVRARKFCPTSWLAGDDHWHLPMPWASARRCRVLWLINLRSLVIVLQPKRGWRSLTMYVHNFRLDTSMLSFREVHTKGVYDVLFFSGKSFNLSLSWPVKIQLSVTWAIANKYLM